MTGRNLKLTKKLEKFKEAIKSPRLYLDDEMSKLKNSIDIEAESILMNLDQTILGTVAQKIIEQEKINSDRKLMIDEIDKYTRKLLEDLPSNELDAEFVEKVSTEIEEFEKSLNEMERIFLSDSQYYKLENSADLVYDESELY